MIIVYLLIGAIGGVLFTFFLVRIFDIYEFNKTKKMSYEIYDGALKQKEAILLSAQNEWESIKLKYKQEWEEIIKKALQEKQEIIKKAERIEKRLLEKEERIDKKLESISFKQEALVKKEEELKLKKEELDKRESQIHEKLMEVASLTRDEARQVLLKKIEKECEADLTGVIMKYKRDLEERKNEIAREILIKSIQQYAWDVTNEVTTTIVPIHGEDIKGKIIWKEGRNIIAFERATGVSLIIDDTPDAVFISSFDLFKRYIAKKALEKLVEDGRIQPARIEEVVENTTAEANILLKNLWKETVDMLGIHDIPEEMFSLIGKLRFRTSYWQNILKHSMEVSYIAEHLAKELKVDAYIAKKWGLLHDIGKAVDHEIEGTHPEIWGKLARQYGLDDTLIEIIECHHDDIGSISIYAAIVQIADAISSVRPGARKETVEQYFKRVQEMEMLAQSFSWVTKAYAVSAGREIRVFVDAQQVNDYEAYAMARMIAQEIERKLSYPWQVKVLLIREMRVIEYAK